MFNTCAKGKPGADDAMLYSRPAKESKHKAVIAAADVTKFLEFAKVSNRLGGEKAHGRNL
jgi:hypothetical protein